MGNGWVGMGYVWNREPTNTHLALVEDRVIGLYHDDIYPGSLHIAMSDSKHATNSTDVAGILRSEYENFMNSSQPRLFGPAYGLLFRRLLPTEVTHDVIYPGLKSSAMYSPIARPSRLTGITVQGTNLVVTVELGTNMVSEIALNKHLRPVWVKTNGVFLDRYVTNAVSFSEIRSNRVVHRFIE
jgi:hypothetical protein